MWNETPDIIIGDWEGEGDVGNWTSSWGGHKNFFYENDWQVLWHFLVRQMNQWWNKGILQQKDYDTTRIRWCRPLVC